jgi:hypothetical protein
MEEIGHVYLGHRPSKLVLNESAVRIRDFDQEQEDDAYGVGAAALLPWREMFQAIDHGKTASELAEEFDVSQSLIEYRIKITGAFRLYRSRQRVRAPN